MTAESNQSLVENNSSFFARIQKNVIPLVGIKIIPLVGIRMEGLLQIKAWRSGSQSSPKLACAIEVTTAYIAKELEHELEECYENCSLLRRLLSTQV